MVNERRGREAGGGKKEKKVGAHPRARASECHWTFLYFSLLFLDFLIALVGYFFDWMYHSISSISGFFFFLLFFLVDTVNSFDWCHRDTRYVTM